MNPDRDCLSFKIVLDNLALPPLSPDIIPLLLTIIRSEGRKFPPITVSDGQ